MGPHRRQPTRLPRPWDSPGKNTGVGCHFLLQFMKVKSESEVAQSCPTPSDPMDCSLPGSSIHGIYQARVLEWGVIAFSILISTSHQLNGHEFQQTARDSEGQESLACCGPWGLYKLDTTEQQHLYLCRWGENTAVNVTISLIDTFLIVKLAFCCKQLLNSCEYCQ